MNKKLNILFCSSEVTPFSKTGGLGDVAGSLPKALAEIGCQVRVIAPKYACVSDISAELKKVTNSVTKEYVGGTKSVDSMRGDYPIVMSLSISSPTINILTGRGSTRRMGKIIRTILSDSPFSPWQRSA